MDVSIIIVNYNTLKMTSECIDSVIEKTHGISYEIILVDNGSTDGSKEYFEHDTRIKYIYSNENLGFGRANNLGATKISGKYMLLLNPDTLLINNAIKACYDSIEKDDSIGIVGGNLYDKDFRATLSYKRYLPGIFWEINNLTFSLLEKIVFRGSETFNKSNKVVKVGYITGADLMIKTSIFNKIGGFDDSYFLYYEETDLCLRVSLLGFSIINTPESKIQHLEGASFDGEKYNINRIKQTEIGRRTFYLKHFSNWKLNSLNFLYHINLGIKAFLHPIAYRRNYAKLQLQQFKIIWEKN